MREIGGTKVPTPVEMSQLAVLTAGKDLQRHPLYSILDYPATTGVTQLNFFSTAEGGSQVIGGNTLTMDRERTNIQKANSFATPNDFILKSIRLWCFPRYAESTIFTNDFAEDMYMLLTTGHLRIVFGSKEWFVVAPLMALSAGGGMSAEFTTSQSTVDRMYTANDHPLVFKVSPWLVIPSELNFKVELNWRTAQTISARCKMGIWLDGEILRPIQ